MFKSSVSGSGRSAVRLAAAALSASILVAQSASAAPVLRFQVDQQGDFVLFGNTLGHDCSSGTPGPIVGSVGACGSNVSDSSPDVFWSSDAPAAGQASASSAITIDQMRSTAVLILPAGAVVTYARIYWGAFAGAADTQATLSRPGVFSTALTADASHTVSAAPDVAYESTALVTSIVQQNGSGAYRLAGADSIPLINLNDGRPYAAWSMVVFYELAGQPLRQLTLFDGLDSASSGSGVVVDISGFLVPQTGIDAKLGVVAYGGDGQNGGDTLTFNGVDLSDGSGGQGFFNESRTFLGSLVSNTGDLPQLTGGSRSMSSVDLDVVDVTAQVTPGSTSATAVAKAGGDNNILIGAFITSITTFKPNFNDSLKTAVDLNGGALLPGDTLEYHINVVNTGNDPGLGVVLEDVIPTGTTYVPGSIAVTSGANVGSKTDPAGDDQGEFDLAQSKVRVRLGTGANATTGGTMAIGESSMVVFQVTVDASAAGSTISNQATISARGQQGAPTTVFTSDSTTGGPTVVVVDQCQSDAQCPAAKPICYDPPNPNICVQCTMDAHCSGTTPICDTTSHTCRGCVSDGECPAVDGRPACNASGPLQGACTECSADNASLCAFPDPICLTNLGICGCTDVDGDSECDASPTSGIICNGPAGSCVPGCSTAVNRNDCPTTDICSKQDGSVGTCSLQPCNTDNDCTTAPNTHCYLTSQPHVCVQCLSDAHCTAPDVCDVNGTHTCVECTPTSNTCDQGGPGDECLINGNCGCITDSDCGAIDSERVCDASVSRCTIGCRGPGFGNGCASGRVCTSTDATIGTCRLPDLCQSNSDCSDPTPVCDTTSVPKHCVGCMSDADCTAEAPVCENNACVGCTSDADCTDAALPACQTAAGDLQGQCTECSATNDTLCGVDVTNGPQNANEPECLTGLGTCGCTDTDGDSECGNATSGRICNGPVGQCADGCSTAQGRNDCPTTQFCSDQTGAVGTCETHCNTDADCTTAPKLVCDTTPIEHVCVECTEQNKSQCSAATTGDECLSDNTCGCNDDADCGATDSGRICGTDNKCTKGCRGTGGNECPDGQVCTSSTSAPGTCVPEQPDSGSDAGPDDAGPPTSANSIEGGGCACSVPSNGSSSPAWAGWAAVLAAAVLRGRRRSRPRR